MRFHDLRARLWRGVTTTLVVVSAASALSLGGCMVVPERGYRGDGYYDGGHRGDGHRGDGHRGDGHRGDGYRGDGYRGDGYRGDGYRDRDVDHDRGWRDGGDGYRHR
jgi:hypothetical protein